MKLSSQYVYFFGLVAISYSLSACGDSSKGPLDGTYVVKAGGGCDLNEEQILAAEDAKQFELEIGGNKIIFRYREMNGEALVDCAHISKGSILSLTATEIKIKDEGSDVSGSACTDTDRANLVEENKEIGEESTATYTKTAKTLTLKEEDGSCANFVKK